MQYEQKTSLPYLDALKHNYVTVETFIARNKLDQYYTAS